MTKQIPRTGRGMTGKDGLKDLLAAAAHEGVPPAGGKQGVEEDGGVGAEAGAVADLGPAAGGGAADGARDDGRLRQKAHGVGLPHCRRLVQRLGLVGSAGGGLREMVRGDDAPVGLDAARLDQRDADAERLHLHPQGVGQGLHGELRDMVPAAEVEDDLAGNGGHIDNGPAPLRPHVRQHELRQPGKAEDIDLQLPAGLLQRHVLDGAERAVTGVVDQHVDASLGLHDRGDTGRHRSLVGHVETQRDDAEGAKRFHPLDPAGGTVDAVAFAGQQHGGLIPDAAARAGEKDYFLLFHNCLPGKGNGNRIADPDGLALLSGRAPAGRFPDDTHGLVIQPLLDALDDLDIGETAVLADDEADIYGTADPLRKGALRVFHTLCDPLGKGRGVIAAEGRGRKTVPVGPVRHHREGRAVDPAALGIDKGDGDAFLAEIGRQVLEVLPVLQIVLDAELPDEIGLHIGSAPGVHRVEAVEVILADGNGLDAVGLQMHVIEGHAPGIRHPVRQQLLPDILRRKTELQRLHRRILKHDAGAPARLGEQQRQPARLAAEAQDLFRQGLAGKETLIDIVGKELELEDDLVLVEMDVGEVPEAVDLGGKAGSERFKMVLKQIIRQTLLVGRLGVRPKGGEKERDRGREVQHLSHGTNVPKFLHGTGFFCKLYGSNATTMKADPTILHRKLKDFFGYDAFKGDQEAIITHLVEGKNAFVLMPTGGGWYFKDDEKKTMILYGGSGDFGRADLAFLNRIPRELRDYAFIYQPSLGLPGNELDLTDVEWF